MTTPTLTDALSETLSVFESTGEPGEPLTTQEVTDRLDVSRRSCYDRLERLAERGLLETKKAGARGRVWWRPPETVAEEADPVPGGADGATMLGRVIDNLPGMVYRCRNEPGWPMSYVSDGCETVTGYGPEEIESGSVSWGADVIHPTDRERVQDVVAAGLREDGEFVVQYRIQTPEGETRWVWERGCAVDDADESADRLEGVIMDVTDRRESERKLSERDEQFRALVEATEEYAIFMLDREGCVKTWNPGAERIKGYDESEIVGEHFSTFYTEGDRAASVPEGNLAAAVENGMVEDEGWRVQKDGTKFWANVTISAIRDEDGELQGFAKVTRDMTARHEYEEQLRAERDFSRRVLETAPATVFVVDDEGTVTRSNDQLWSEIGLEAGSEGPAVDDLAIYDEAGDPVPSEERPYRRVFETGERIADWRCQVELPSGERRWLSLNVAPIRESADDEVESAVVAAQDVTQLKEQARLLERQRDDLESELEAVFERVDDAFFALDEDWRFTYVNDKAADVLGRTPTELLGGTLWENFPDVTGSTFEDEYRRAVETQESVTFTAFYPPLSNWFEVNAYPSGDGLSVYFRDVTDRRARERELEEARRRYQTLVEQFPNGAVALVDEYLHYQAVGGTPIEEANVTVEEITGQPLDEVLDPAMAEILRPRYEAALDGEKSAFESEIGEHVYQFRVHPVRDDDGEVFAALGMSQDVTERKVREQELQLYETIVDTIDDGVYVLDEDFCFTKVNDAYVEMTGYDRDELLGTHCSLVIDDEVSMASANLTRAMAAGETDSATLEADLQRKDGSTIRAESRFTPLPNDDPENPRKIGVVRDVSERVERERELERRVRQQEVITELGQRALEDRDLDGLLAEAAERVAETLETDFTEVLELQPDGEELLLREGIGWREGTVGQTTVPATEDGSQAAHTLGVDEPVVVEAHASESRFDAPDLLGSHDVSSGITTIVGPIDEPWGILGTHDSDERSFSDNDVAFVQSVANILANAIERHGYEDELLRQRERLDALNNLNGVVRNITEAAIEQSTREEIEQVVCEALADSDSYMFAWTGEVDLATETVETRAEAGVEGYLDDVTISVDPDDPRSEGATGRALRTGTVQTTRDVFDDARYDQWLDHVADYGFRSSAAIPMTHEETTFGVLNVYADRPDAFEGEEREVVAQLGEILGHAIAAIERKRALMSDEVVELEFRIANVFEAIGLSLDPDGRIVLRETVPIRDHEYLVYGTVTEDAVDVLSTIVDAVDHWEDVTVHDGEGERTFELRLSEPPVLSTVAALGGTVDEAVIEDGDYQMTVRLSPSADVRKLIDVVQEAYPTAKMLRRQQVTRTADAGERVESVLAEGLTDRQRTALRAAYHADFFEWPRETTGEELADSLDVSPPTFHQHLRKAEQKVFESLLSDGDVAEPST